MNYTTVFTGAALSSILLLGTACNIVKPAAGNANSNPTPTGPAPTLAQALKQMKHPPTDFDTAISELEFKSKGGTYKGVLEKCSDKWSDVVRADDKRVRAELDQTYPGQGLGKQYKGQAKDSFSLECNFTLDKEQPDHHTGAAKGATMTQLEISLPDGYDDTLKQQLQADGNVDKHIVIGYNQWDEHAEKLSRSDYLATSVHDLVSVATKKLIVQQTVVTTNGAAPAPTTAKPPVHSPH